MSRGFHRLIGAIKSEPALSLIIVCFLLFSLTGLFHNFGLATTVGDEAPSLSAALKMIDDHTLRPAYPTFYYLPVAAFAVLPFALLGVLTLPLFGVAASFDAIREFVIVNFAQLLPWARFASACYAALAVYVLYRIARRLFERKEGAVLATFLFSTSILFLQAAHFAKVWSAMLLAILFTLWAILRLFEEPTRRRYLIATCGTVLSFGFNMIGALVYVSFVVAHALRTRGQSFVQKFFMHRNFLLAHGVLFAGVALFYYLNPYGFENYLGFVKKFTGLLGTSSGAAQIVSGGNAQYCGSGLISGLTYYAHVLFAYELPMTLLAFAGLMFYRRRVWEKRNEIIILASFAGVYFVVITLISAFGVNPCQPRYILPVIPVLAILATITVTGVREGFGRRFSSVILFVVVLIALYGPVMFDLRLALPSTKLEAREWILTNVTDGARVVAFEERLDLPENETTLRDIQAYAPFFLTKKRAFLLDASDKASQGPRYYVLNPSYFGKGIPASLTETPYDYVVLRWWDPSDRAFQLARFRKLGLVGTMELVVRFPSDATDETISYDLGNDGAPLSKLHTLTQNGPVIEVYRIR